MISDPAVILERFTPRGLLAHAGHRDIADLQKFRGSEEAHIGGVMINRIDHAALIKKDSVHPTILQFNAASEAGGSCANNDGV
jgi:hypothetical protein